MGIGKLHKKWQSMQRMPKMAKNGKVCQRMAKNGKEWQRMAKNGKG